MELGSGGGDLLWLTRALGVGWTLCGEDHLWAGAREKGRSPSQGLAKGTFSDSVTAISSGWYVPYPVQSTTNRYVPRGMYLGTPFRYVPVHTRHVGHVTMYLCPLNRESDNKEHPPHPPSIHPIPSHPTRPCPAWDNVISPQTALDVGHQTRKALDDAGREAPKFLPAVVCPMCLSVRSPAERAHARYQCCVLPLPVDTMRKRLWLRYLTQDAGMRSPVRCVVLRCRRCLAAFFLPPLLIPL